MPKQGDNQAMNPPALKQRAPFPFRHFARNAGYAAVLNVVCAVVITAITGAAGYFWHTLVYSMCIGSIIFVLVEGARLAIWGAHTRPNWRIFLPILLLAVPVGQYGGTAAGHLLLGRPLGGLGRFWDLTMNSMLAFTLVAAIAAMLLFIGRERMMRVEAAFAAEKARTETIERQALQTQLRLLQAQIEPHMLFNTLANLQGLIAIDPERAQAMLDQLIHYLRATLSSSRAEHTTLAQEFTLLDAYLGLISVRMGARMRYTLDLPAELAGIKLPPMLLQPLVENAVVHGIEPNVDGGHIGISVARRGETLELCVADTGLGLDAEPGKPGTGLGVTNTRERLQAVYGAGASLALEPNTPRGALARLILPLQTP